MFPEEAGRLDLEEVHSDRKSRGPAPQGQMPLSLVKVSSAGGDARIFSPGWKRGSALIVLMLLFRKCVLLIHI